MSTREELLSGVVKVNHERKDLKAVEEGRKEKVRHDDGNRSGKSSGIGGAHGVPAKAFVQWTEGSLEEVLARRKAQGAAEVARLTEQIDADVAARQQLKKELKAIDKVLEEL